MSPTTRSERESGSRLRRFFAVWVERWRRGSSWPVRVALSTVLVLSVASCASIGVNTPEPFDPAATDDAVVTKYGRGIPFGPTKLPFDKVDGVYTGTKINPGPETIVSELEAARAAGLRVVLVLTGAQSNYRNADGSYNLELWKEKLDGFRGVDFEAFIEDGTVVAHQIIDEAKARSQWDGTVIPNDVIDEMARYSKEIWPAMLTAVRVDPTLLVTHARAYDVAWPDFRWTYVDTAWAPYSDRKGPVVEYALEQQRSADEQGLGLMLELNAYNGGDGSSGMPSPDLIRPDRWAMSARELVEYGSALLRNTRGCGLMIWRYETEGSEFEDVVYFRRADVAAAMEDLAAVAADVPAYPCHLEDR